MRVTIINTGGLDLTPPSVRSPGTHVSDVIRDLMNTIIKPGERNPYDTLSPAEKKRLGNYASGGWAWEQVIRDGLNQARVAAGIPPNYHHLGELECDGLYGTPDWYDGERNRDVEFKCTWRSSLRPIEDFWEWLTQIRAYCYMLDVTEAEIHALFINGDYRESGPEYKAWHLEFEPFELKENWSMLKMHSRSRGFLERSHKVLLGGGKKADEQPMDNLEVKKRPGIQGAKSGSISSSPKEAPGRRNKVTRR